MDIKSVINWKKGSPEHPGWYLFLDEFGNVVYLEYDESGLWEYEFEDKYRYFCNCEYWCNLSDIITYNKI